MRALFTLDAKGDVTIDPHALGLLPYKKIWDRDKSKSKSKAIAELSYVYYMNDFRSFVGDITDHDTKHNEVIKMIFKGSYTPDKAVLDASELYKQDVPYSVGVLEDAKTGVEALRVYLREVDLMAEDDKGKLKHDAAKLKATLISLSGITESITKLELKVKQDVDSSIAVAGGRIKGMFEDEED